MSDRHAQLLRLPRDIAEGVQKEAGRRGISANAYMLQAVEERLKADKAFRKEADEQRRHPRKSGDKDRPRGLGLRISPPVESALPPQPVETPAVVVNVGRESAAEESSSLIRGLADFVMAGPLFSRDQRKRTAVDILKANGKTEAAREDLARQLDAAIAERAAAPASANGIRQRFSSIGSLFGS